MFTKKQNKITIFFLILRLTSYSQSSIDSNYIVEYKRIDIRNNSKIQNCILFITKNISYYTFPSVYEGAHNGSTAYTFDIETNSYQKRNLILRPDTLINEIKSNIFTSLKYDLAGNRFCVTENKPTIKWTVLNDKKTILGYECQLAKGDISGSIYFAWFAKNISPAFGPYKIGGLDGLILEVYDSNKKIVHIIAKKIDDSKKSKILNQDCNKKISFEEFKKLMEKQTLESNNYLQKILSNNNVEKN
ncbi:MAG: GLPGLI family protein [Chitinophagaceae bacterium]|nr:GLPGLI family protein [Chitinophagaceae bacterium]